MSKEALSPELRKRYEASLSRKGGWGPLCGAVFAFFFLSYGVDTFVPRHSGWYVLGVFGVLAACCVMFRTARIEEIEEQKRKAGAMPDDQLAREYEEHSKSSRQAILLLALAIGALAFGLLFTPQGNELLTAFLAGAKS